MQAMHEMWLVLSDGSAWRCESSWNGEREGEVVFTTSSNGYPQSLSDPSYCGQMLAFAFPPTGIYGIDAERLESARPWAAAAIVGTLEKSPLSGTKQLAEWLQEHDTPLVTGLDTRALILHLREKGTMMGRLSPIPTPPVAQSLPGALVDRVSVVDVHVTDGAGPTVGVIDYGVKEGILRSLTARGLRVVRFPHDADAETILASKPDGVLLSNGPGDPAALAHETEVISKLVGKVPLFGICLGNQLLARACGGETVKLPYGHRGANQPVVDVRTGRGFVTSQNHGYTVKESSLAGTELEVLFRHLGDGTVEGVHSRKLRAFGVQFHPEACPGPQDTAFLFDEFLIMVREEAVHA